MKKIFKIILILVLIFAIWAFIRFVIGGPEDDWICIDGEWVKHGNPRDPMPTETCGKELNTNEDSSLEIPGTNLVLLDVPFISQAPYGNWQDEVFQNACEEASLIMAMKWVEGKTIVDKDEAVREIQAMSDFEIENYGDFYDTSAQDIPQLVKDYWNYDKVEARYNIGAEDIKNELLKGNLVIVPVNGQKLGNPHYTPPGPIYHMLLIKGYDFKTGEFITNDSGTRYGENYRYQENIVENALQDYDTGHHKPILEIRKVMIVVKK